VDPGQWPGSAPIRRMAFVGTGRHDRRSANYPVRGSLLVRDIARNDGPIANTLYRAFDTTPPSRTGIFQTGYGPHLRITR